MQSILKSYLNDVFDATPKSIDAVSGGNIATSYKVSFYDQELFVKIQPYDHGKALNEKEIAGLKVLQEQTHFIVPKIIDSQTMNGRTFLTLAYLSEHTPHKKDWENFGRSLALMHGNTSPQFGWKNDNFIGTLPQRNELKSDWTTFFLHQRISPLLKTINQKHPHFCSTASTKLAEYFKGEFPEEPPSLLHGDLWSGNVMNTTNGFAIFDPACYYGHREMDIAMTQLFGGFDKCFLNAYQEVYPLAPGWQERIELCQIYPLLVHAVLFGGHYLNTCSHLMKKYFSPNQ